jgi:phage terminase large subunit-like protein
MNSPAVVLPGTASPRVLLEPARSSSEGDDAAWLASSYGLVPDPWQVDVLRGWLGVRDGRWAAARCGTACPRQNGKNGIVEVRELYGTVALGERILHTAHEVKTARKAFARLLEFFDNERQFPELAGMVREIRRTNGQEAIVLTNGGSVEFIARSRGSGRGFSVDVLVADEAQELSEDAWAALRPTIAASANPQVILLGTPPPPGATGEVFARFRASGVAGADDRLDWREWSCADDLETVDLDDREEWALRNPALGVRLREDTVADERSEMDPQTFARERLGWWQAREQRAAAIDPAAWSDLADPAAERGPSPTFAVATAPDRSWSAVAVAWRRPDGRAQVMLADYRPGAAWVPERVAELRSRWGGTVAVDTASRGLVPDAQDLSQAQQAQAHNALADAVEAGTVRHGNEPALNTAVRAARWKPQGDSRVLDRKGSADISPLVAAALAVHGLTTAATGGWMVGV